MAQVAEPIVGRAAELGSLEHALADLEHGRGRIFELVGEPGMGKTRLLAELGARAVERGHLLLAGSASELERDLPFWVFVDALDEHLESSGAEVLTALDDDARAELRHVLPALAALDAGPGAALQHERYRTHRAVRRLLEELAPLVMTLDDLHWADSGSTELLGSLLRRPPAAPVLIAVALRPRQVPERLWGPLERAHRAGTLERLELTALTEAEARELLGPAGARVYADSGGNPFYLQQLARAGEHVADGGSALALSGVPPMVTAALAEELTALDDTARLVLQGAAVAGDPFEPELAAAAAGVPDGVAIEALDDLLARDLVRHTEVPRRFRFRHPLVRRAVYEAAPAGWRLMAHERSADALAARGAEAAARAHHVERAARHGDAAAIAVLREAGDAALQRTPAGAARWFRAALRLLPDAAPAQERTGLLTSLAGALAATGDFVEARAALLECLRILPGDVRLAAACAGVESLLGHHREAHGRLRGALDGLEDQSSPEAGALMISLSLDAFYRMDYAASRDWAARALELAGALGGRPLVAGAAALLAIASAFIGDIAAATGHCTRAAELVDAMGDDELAQRLDAAAHLAGAEAYLDRFAAGIAHARRGLALARATGQGELVPALIPALATNLFVCGRLAEAAEATDGAIEAARLVGNAQGLAWHLLNRAMVSRLIGDGEAALAEGRESVELTRDLDESLVSCYAGVIHGVALIDDGQHAGGVETLVRAAGGPDLPMIPGGWRAFYLEQLTGALLALGRRADAQRAAATAAAVAQATGLTFPAAMAKRAAAALALDAGDASAAAALALAAVADADAVGARIDAGLARTLAGRALAQAADRDGAAAELERAAVELNACGAARWRDEAERELGRRLRGGAPLTGRELEVAQLIVERKTNAQIAAELFLSQKTVESHVRNIFHKLGVSSRVEVARSFERSGR